MIVKHLFGSFADSGNFDHLICSGGQFLKRQRPAIAATVQFDVERWTFAVAVHIPTVNAVTVNGKKLHKIHINVAADTLGYCLGDVESAYTCQTNHWANYTPP